VVRSGTTRILFNAEDRIVRVDAPGTENTPPPGTELTDYIGSAELAALYRQLFATVRNSRPKISLMARCDDPSARAVLAIEIARYGEGGHVELRSSIVRRSERKAPWPEPESSSGEEIMVLVCSWCNFVSEDNHWVELEAFVERQGWLISETPRVQFTHGLCPSCSGYLRAAAAGRSGPPPPVDI
jgi:hypothetical protein